MREIITHHTDVLFPHAEDAEGAKILLYNAIAGGIAGYARRENAEVVGNQWLYSIFVSHPASALSRRSETCDISSVSVKSRGIKTPRSLRSLREHELTLAIRKFCGFCAREYPHLYELRNYISHGIHRIHRNDIIGGEVKGASRWKEYTEFVADFVTTAGAVRRRIY